MDIAISHLASLLRESGAWGLLAVVLVVVWRMMLYIRDQHEERIDEQRATYELLAGVKLVLESHEKAYDRFVHKLDRIHSELGEEGSD